MIESGTKLTVRSLTIITTIEFAGLPVLSLLIFVQLEKPRKRFITTNTSPEPFVLCEFCKKSHTHGHTLQEPKKKLNNTHMNNHRQPCTQNVTRPRAAPPPPVGQSVETSLRAPLPAALQTYPARPTPPDHPWDQKRESLSEMASESSCEGSL